MVVFADVCGVEPEGGRVGLLDADIALLEGDFAGSDGLDLGAGEADADLKG